MNRNQFRLLSIGFIVLLMAIFLIVFWLVSGEEEEVAEIAPEVVERPVITRLQILVANKRMELGHVVEPGDVRWQTWDDDLSYAGLLTRTIRQDELDRRNRELREASLQELDDPGSNDGINPDPLADFAAEQSETIDEGDLQLEGEASVILGRVALGQTFVGEPIILNKFASPGPGSIVSVLLRPNMRAVTLAINQESSIGGTLKAQDYVDIIHTRTVRVENSLPSESIPQGLSEEANISETIIANILVLEVNVVGGGGSGVVTLELTEEQSRLISLAKRTGVLSVILRPLVNYLPGSFPQTTGVLGAGILGESKLQAEIDKLKRDLAVAREKKVNEIEEEVPAVGIITINRGGQVVLLQKLESLR